MARATLLLLSLVFTFLYIAARTESAGGATTTAAANFIKSSCSATTYPDLCFDSLAVYAPAIQRSPRQLCHTALSVSVQRAQATKDFVNRLRKFKGLKPREYGALKDCFDELSDSVDRLSKSVQEMKNLGSPRSADFQWHMSNVETWASAALTDDSTCMDGFSGRFLNGRIKTSIRSRVTNVAQVTSNALALINQYAAKYY